MNRPHRSPTISDVAKRAGVSIATVSRVINATAPVEPETVEKVTDAVQELHYLPRSAARVLASRRTGAIGLLLTEIGGGYFSPLLRGIEAGARQAGYDLLIHCTRTVHPDLAQFSKAPYRPLAEHNTDGLLIFTDSVDLRELARLYKIGFPMVLLHQTPPENLRIPFVTVENKAGAEKLISHLIAVHGKRRIVFLRGPEAHEDSSWRERGYREALERHGLVYDPSLVAPGGFNESVAYQSVRELLNAGVRFDAVFAGDDDAAHGVLQALQEFGKHVPEQVALVGFDDLSFSRFMYPPLTTVSVPIEEVGKTAVRLLARLIRDEQVESKVLLPTEVVIRQSCGC
jgi:DNA-binding LacI/PurR family transcriptional regulator